MFLARPGEIVGSGGAFFGVRIEALQSARSQLVSAGGILFVLYASKKRVFFSCAAVAIS